MNMTQVRKALASVSALLVVALAALVAVTASIVVVAVCELSSDAYMRGANAVGAVLLAVSLAMIATVDAQEKTKPEEEWRAGKVADRVRLAAAAMSVVGAALVVVAALVGAGAFAWG